MIKAQRWSESDMGGSMSRAALSLAALALLVLAVLTVGTAAAQEPILPAAPNPESPLHPTFPLLDANGNHVVISREPLSTMDTCGACHDTQFIAGHSFHVDVGLRELGAPGETTGSRPWEISPGLFGGWSPITYRSLTAAGEERVDLTTVEWLKLFGVRHVGGGPAELSRDGTPLVQLSSSELTVENSILDPQTGLMTPWDWEASGTVEMNCFICHLSNPDNEARKTALHTGDFQWANSATLLTTGVLKQTEDGFAWNEAAFEQDGSLSQGTLDIRDPGNENCGLCHGLVHVDAQTPLVLNECQPEQWSTITTGQIMSPQRISDSGVNVTGKESLRRSWDIHMERVVSCTDCHYSLNNPVYYRELTDSRPDHLQFDPRRIELSEYLYRPLHQFAKGESAQGALAQGLDDTIRGCDDCHDTSETHEWLPYNDRHMSALSCESCHVPSMVSPARQSYDWTVLQVNGDPVVTCRGIEGDGSTFATALTTGFDPVLLPREDSSGGARLGPHNLISSWYWVYGDPPRPVRLLDLKSAWLDGKEHHPAVVAVFDANGDGLLSDLELLIDSEQKETIIASRLSSLGLDRPRIVAEIQPYSISHNVVEGEWAIKDCQACHSEDSRLELPMLLADRTPGGVVPLLSDVNNTALSGELTTDPSGRLFYQPSIEASQLYILGRSSVKGVDLAGAILFAATLLGVVAHGGLRFYTARRRSDRRAPEVRELYMYSVYERLWHWLQTAAISLLLFTGLIIHKPDLFGLFSFRYVVEVHNILAIIMVANAALSLFYHLASGEIKQFLPQPRGFFSQAIVQATFYLRGIFKGEQHPFQKRPSRKMNPLQQLTYLGLLNVLLPLQVITGILIWGAQRWPELASQLGGLTLLSPLHTMVSWLLASFIVLHVYLTTTGPTPAASIKGMMMGWDEVEVHGAAAD